MELGPVGELHSSIPLEACGYCVVPTLWRSYVDISVLLSTRLLIITTLYRQALAGSVVLLADYGMCQSASVAQGDLTVSQCYLSHWHTRS